jgi:methylated-DNA-protein-cysteine methyltransferase related protein
MLIQVLHAERKCAGAWVMPMSATTYERIYAVVSGIPEGRVATYGQVARLAGMPGRARLVGYALSSLHDRVPVPWHRVVNAGGRISPRSGGSQADAVQRLRLEAEGVSFDEHGRIPLDRFQWQPAGSEAPWDL